MAVQLEPEIAIGRRAWPQAQTLFAGAALSRLPTRVAIGWHGTSVEAEPGAFAVVRDGAGLDDLIGEVLHIVNGRHEAYVYVLGSRAVPQDISISRRAFLALGRLSLESLTCVVEVIA